MLDKQPFTLPLAQGMTQKKDPKTLTGGLTLVENGIYRKDGETEKRLGWVSLSKTKAAGGSISSADACAAYGSELLLWSDNHIHTWSEAQTKWYDRGAAYSAAVDLKQIISSNASYTFADSAYVNGIVLVTYELGLAIYYQMYDYTTGAVLKGDTLLTAAGHRPKCLALNGQFYIFYSNTVGANLNGAIISASTGAVTSTVTLATDNKFGFCFDVLAVSTDAFMLSYGNTSNNIVVKYLNSSLGARGGTYTDSSSATGTPVFLRLVPISSTRVVIAYQGSATNIQARVVTSTGSVGSALDTGLSKTAESGEVYEITGHESGSDARLYIGYNLLSTSDRVTYKIELSTSGGAHSSAVFIRSVGLAIRGFMHESVGFVGVFYSSALQDTLFIVDQDGVVVSRHQPGTFGTSFFQNIAQVWTASTGRYEFAITNKTRVINTTDTQKLFTFSGGSPSSVNLYSPLNVAMSAIDFQDNSNFSTAELGDTLLIVGGSLSMYDGVSVVEHGFHVFPEGLSAVSSAAGSVPNGTYLYAAVYEWTDAKGMTHRSAPSVPLSVTVSAGPKRVDLKVPMLRITQKKGVRANVTIAIYRTQISQSSPFYRISSLTGAPQNDTTLDSYTFQDNALDASLLGHEFLYTAGGVLDNGAALPAKYIKVWRGRVMLGGLEQSAIQYSKPWQQGSPVEFSPENILELESDGGPMTAFEILDEKLVAFKENWGYQTFGDGPNALGLGGAFAPLERISSLAVGCIDQQSTCAIPGGVIFKSRSGYQVLGSDLSAAAIGADVEDYDALLVSSATLFSNESEVRITNKDGVALVYNYEFQRWSVFTNYESVDAMRWNGKFVHAKSDGSICIETAATWRDNAVNFNISFITGWNTLSDISGFQRIYRAQIVGEYKSPVTLTLEAGYDFEQTWDDTGSIAFSAAAYRGQFHMKRQKCQSIRFRITVAVSEFVFSGEGMKLTALTLLFGIKRGLSKLRSSLKTGLT